MLNDYHVPPAPGNILSATIGGVTASYTVANGDSLASAAAGLASAITAQESAAGVQADGVGDRIVLRSTNVATLFSQIALLVGDTIGSAPALALFATQTQPTFLDSTAYGYHGRSRAGEQ